MKRFLYILFLAILASCEKYDNDPEKRGYTPEPIDDNSWTINIIDGDTLIGGMNPKDSTFMGSIVYKFMSKYEGYVMIVDNGKLSPKHNKDILIRAVDASHINLGIRNCSLIDDKGNTIFVGDVIFENVELKENDSKIVFSKSDISTNTKVSGELANSCLSLVFDMDVNHNFIQFYFLSHDAYKRDYPQVENGDFEVWTYDGDNLPNSWNSFQTATGSYAHWYYMKKNRQVERSSALRPNSKGRNSCHIWANKIVELVVPGHITTGRLSLGSMIPTKENNFVYSDRKSGDSSNPGAMPFVGLPDSIAFWVKFIPASDSISEYKTAKFTACIHDDEDYVLFNDEVYDNEVNKSHLVAKAAASFESKDGRWQRISVPFVYTNNKNAQYILIDISTNSVPGKGTFKDNLYIDDIETIYTKVK